MFFHDWSFPRLVALRLSCDAKSMFNLNAENGPCLVNEDGNTTYLNPYR